MVTVQWSMLKDWFARKGYIPFPFQLEAWDRFIKGESGLIHAPTGTGKTYAAWLGVVGSYLNKDYKPGLKAVWITPMRALASDVQKAISQPAEEMLPNWKVESRTGDTSSYNKVKQNKNLPDALVTTPESLSLLLSYPEPHRRFKNLKFIIVDEWHELLSSKRGVQTELAIARLKKINPDLQIWGISATLGNLDIAMEVLLSGRKGKMVSASDFKAIEVDSIIPDEMENFPWSGHLGLRTLPQVVQEIDKYRSVIVFTNVRSQAEMWFQALLEYRPDWAGIIGLHHSSIARHQREVVEAGLKAGKFKCVVSTSSLDLGVDFPPVEGVIQVGSPKGIARIMQRAGRSGHEPGKTSRIVCVPTHAFELLEIAAVKNAVEKKYIESRPPYSKPLDVLIQHIVTCAASESFTADELFNEVKTSYTYRNLTRDEFNWCLEFVTTGGKTLGAYPEFQKVHFENGKYFIQEKRIATRHRMSIGTITGDASLSVKFLKGNNIGSIEESFITKIKPGDTFIFAGRNLELIQVKEMTVYVKKSASNKGLVPKWAGGRLPLSTELARHVRLRLTEVKNGKYPTDELKALRTIFEIQKDRSQIPSDKEFLIEKLKTREGHHLFFFPFEGKLVNEGISTLVAYRLSQLKPISFSIASNDYGFELLSADEIEIDNSVLKTIFSTDNLLEDIRLSVNAAELGKRQFRDIARVSGLVFQGFIHSKKTTSQVQASSGLFYDMFRRYDPENLLLKQAEEEVLERQLEQTRLAKTVERISQSKMIVQEVMKPTPLAFPVLATRFREKLSSQTFEDRIKKMQLQLERY